ncbi:mannosyltransferase [Diaphorobacter sp. HDW4A]|nr:mannosyltransferase [Diaphorobacter sp. HDW4A]
MSQPQDIALRDKGELLLARLIYGWERLRNKPVRDYVAKSFELIEIPLATGAKPAPNTRSIPRIIWAFWTGASKPELIERCFANWHRMCPQFDIRILDEDSVLQYLDAIPPSLQQASAPKRADWVRAELLKRHGGIWLDASTILTTSLDWVIDEQARTQSDYVGFYLEQFTADAAYPVIENWFMAAPPGSPFIVDLQDEFTTRVVPGSNEAYIDKLREEGVYDQLRQRIFSPEYLTMHLAIQYVMRKRGGYRLALARAEDGPFYYHVAARWSRGLLKVQLMMRPRAPVMPPMVKLRKPDRKRLDLYTQRRLVRPDSILGHYLGL